MVISALFIVVITCAQTKQTTELICGGEAGHDDLQLRCRKPKKGGELEGPSCKNRVYLLRLEFLEYLLVV